MIGKTNPSPASSQVQISPYTRKMLRMEAWVKTLLGLCVLAVFGFLCVLIGYLGFRGLFIRNEVDSAVLPDYQEQFTWPATGLVLDEPMSLWLSSAIDLGKLRGDQLHAILAGEQKNWVDLASSDARLKVFLTSAQLKSLAEANVAAGQSWSKSRNIEEKHGYESAAVALLQTPGAMAILPGSWDQTKWKELRNSVGLASFGLPHRVSLAFHSPLLSPEGIRQLEQSGELETQKLPPANERHLPQTQYKATLKAAKPLLPAEGQLCRYNWLTGKTEDRDLQTQGYQPLRLKFREYEILKLSFLYQAPAKNGKVGGISTMLFSSLILIVVSLLWAVPLGLAVAVFLVEYAQTGARTLQQKKWQNNFANTVNMAIQTLSGIPSIIFGLFGSILFVPILGIGLLSGAATLVLMLLPTIILTAKEALLSVPRSYIEGSLGLGAQKWYTIMHISLPSALPGILAGIILAIGRALGETAALIYTLGTGYQAALSRFPQLLNDFPTILQEFWLNPSLAKLVQVAQDYPLLDLHSSLRSISLHLYWMTINGISLQKGFSTAFILIFLIVLLNMGARALLTRFSREPHG